MNVDEQTISEFGATISSDLELRARLLVELNVLLENQSDAAARGSSRSQAVVGAARLAVVLLAQFPTEVE